MVLRPDEIIIGVRIGIKRVRNKGIDMDADKVVRIDGEIGCQGEKINWDTEDVRDEDKEEIERNRYAGSDYSDYVVTSLSFIVAARNRQGCQNR